MTPPVTPHPTPRARLTRALWFALLLAATLAYYFWTGMVSFDRLPRIYREESDHFNLLARGFRKGQLYLDHEVPAGLLQAANPYDPALRGTVSVLHDASYFQGKYYLYFGPAPVLTLLVPFSLLTGHDLPLPYGVWFFTSAGFLALAAGFLLLQRRHFPRASLWTVTAGLVALGGANMAVALLRRSNIWEFSAAAGFCFFSLALHGLLRALASSRPRLWASLGGLALGLAVASRPTYIVGSALFALPVLFRARGDAYDWRALLGAALGCGLPVLGLLAYNHARFGNPLEFGLTYQLTTVIESQSRHFSPTYVPFNFHVYFLSALRWTPWFPFVNGINLPPFPPGHGGHEYTFGLFTNLPFSLLGLVTLAALFARRRADALSRSFRLGVIVLAGAALLNATFLLFFFGNCLRYSIDFAPWFMLLAALGVLFAEERLRATFTRYLLRFAALALALFSSFTAAASVVNFYYSTPGEPLSAYRPLARALNLPLHWLARSRWPDYGPRELTLTLPADRSPRHEPLLSVNRPGRPASVVFIDYLDAHKARLGYREGDQPPVHSPAFAAPPGTHHTLRLSVGGPYSDFNGARGRLRAQLDGFEIWDTPAVSLAAFPGDISLGSAGPARFTGQLHASRPIAMSDAPRPRITGVRVRLPLKPDMAGRSFPLLTTGQTRAGDILLLNVHDSAATISFGYDHWGSPLLSSPVIPAPPGQPLVVEFWAPALAPPGTASDLHVKINGATVWRHPVTAFAATPEAIFLGANPIDGSTCELTFPGAVFEDLQLPPPR